MSARSPAMSFPRLSCNRSARAAAARGGGERGSAAVGELVGMQMADEAGPDAGLEHGAALVGAEGALLAERVDAVGELLVGRLRDQFLQDGLDPGPRLHLRRNG